MKSVLIMNFPDEDCRKDFIGKLDRLFAIEGNDAEDYYSLHSQEKSITYQLPDESDAGEVDGNQLFDFFYNHVPFGKTFREAHGWGVD